MKTITSNPRSAAILGFLFLIPGAVLLSMLLLGIEPKLGPLEPYLQAPQSGPHILGSLIVVGAIVILPAIGVLVYGYAVEPDACRNALSSLLPAVIIGFVLMAPFAVLESVYGGTSYTSFPFPLFGILWFLPAVFTLIAGPLIRQIRNGSNVLAWSGIFSLRISALLLTAIFWAGIVIDQLPCFLGVPNCD